MFRFRLSSGSQLLSLRNPFIARHHFFIFLTTAHTSLDHPGLRTSGSSRSAHSTDIFSTRSQALIGAATQSRLPVQASNFNHALFVTSQIDY